MKRFYKKIIPAFIFAFLVCTVQTANAQANSHLINNNTLTSVNSCDLFQMRWDFNTAVTHQNQYNFTIKIQVSDKFEYLGFQPLAYLTNSSQTASPGYITYQFDFTIPPGTGPDAGGTGGFVILDFKAASSGDFTNCVTTNTATLDVDGVANVDSKSHNITIKAQPFWKITKKAAGFVNCNTVRYLIKVESEGCGGTNLYNAQLTESPSDNGQIIGQSSNLGTANGNVFSLGNLIAASAPYEYYVDIQYPATLAPGYLVKNQVSLQGANPDPCKEPAPAKPADFGPINARDSVLLQKIEYGAIPVLKKDLLYTDRNNAQGCQNVYKITLENKTLFAIDQIVIEDDFPCNDLKILSSISSNAPLSAFYVNGTPNTLAGFSGNTPCPMQLKFDFGNYILQPGQTLQILIPFTVLSSAGTMVTNKITASGQGMSAYLNDFCTGDPIVIPQFSGINASHKFEVEKIKPRPIISKSVLTGPSHQPNDPITFRICISNYGGAPFTVNLSDDIDEAVLENITPGDIKVYYDYAANTSCSYNPSNQLPAGTVVFNAGTHLLTGAITVPAQCQLNKYSNVVIEYTTKIKADARPCVYENIANIKNSTINLDAKTKYTVRLSGLFTLNKSVDTDNDGIADNSPVYAGQKVRYSVTFKNITPAPLNNIKIFDNLPGIGDYSIYGGTARNSAVNTVVSSSPAVTVNHYNASNVLVATVASTTSYHAGWIPAVTTATCPTVSGTSSSANSKALSVNLGSFSLPPNEYITLSFFAEVPPTEKATGVTHNDAFICASLNYPGTKPRTCTADPLTNPAMAPSQTPYADFTVYKYEIPCCKGNDFKAGFVNANTTALSNAYNVWNGNFNISYSGPLVQQLTITVVDFEMNFSEPACANLFSVYPYTGTISVPGSTSSVGTLNRQNISYAPYSAFPREIRYGDGNSLVDFSPGLPLNLKILLPSILQIKCCKATAKITLKFSFKDANCNQCDYYYTIPQIEINP